MATATLPNFQATGAIHAWLGSPYGFGVSNGSPFYGGPLYLGTAESTPTIEITNQTKTVMNDITGPTLPAQKIDNGESATVGILLNRFSKSTLAAALNLQAGALINNGTGTLGRRSRFSRGQLQYGITTCQLYLVYDLVAGDPTNARIMYPGIEMGWYFPQVEIINQKPIGGNGRDQQWLVVLDAQPVFTPQASINSVGASERQFFLYSLADSNFVGLTVPQ